jgi:excisionase family DNA binding protein
MSHYVKSEGIIMSEYLTVDQAATLLHVSPSTIRLWFYQGSLPAKKANTGRNARVLIDKDDLHSLLSPVSSHAPSTSYEHRKAAVDRILAFRRKVEGRGLDVDALIELNQQERDRA